MGTSVRPLPSSSSVVREQRGNNNTMAEFGLKKKEVEALDFAFDVYDFKGNGEVDAFYTGDLLRACNLNPTLKTIAEIGGEKEKGKRMLKKADCYPIYEACKESKDQGGFHDFVEILKLYDKNEDNTILSHQLTLHFTSLHFFFTSLHFTSLHFTSLHFTSHTHTP